MLRHVVLFELREGTTPAQRAALIQGLSAMKDEIAELKELSVGPSLRPGPHEVGLIADLEDEAAFDRYVSHPAHQKVIKDLVEPLMTGVATIQIPLGASR